MLTSPIQSPLPTERPDVHSCSFNLSVHLRPAPESNVPQQADGDPAQLRTQGKESCCSPAPLPVQVAPALRDASSSFHPSVAALGTRPPVSAVSFFVGRTRSS